MKSGIYIIRNLVNNKVYIGKSKNVKQRKNAHFSALKLNKHNNQHLQNSYNKYGKNNFQFDVLEYCEESLLPSKEMYYIELYKNNYNIIQSIDNRQDFPQEMKDKMKQSKIHKGLTVSIYSYNINTQEITKWDSIKECSNTLDLNRRMIQKILKDKKHSYKGFRFNYTGVFNNIIKIGGSPAKSVFVYDVYKQFIGEYFSILQCSKMLKISRPFISKSLDTNEIYSKHYFYSVRLPSQ